MRCRLCRRLAAWKRGESGPVKAADWRSRRRVSGKRVFCHASHGVYASTRHPHLGNCTATFGSLLVTTENKAVAGVRELMGSRRGAVGRSARKRVEPSRVARESGTRAADTNARGIRCLSGAYPVSVRCCQMRSAVGFAATVAEPFRRGKRVRARITASQAPFRQERGTPYGCASLRGVDRPSPRP